MPTAHKYIFAMMTLAALAASAKPAYAQEDTMSQIQSIVDEVMETTGGIVSGDTSAPPPSEGGAAQGAAANTLPRKFDGRNFSELPWKNSLMFDEIQIDQLYNTLSGQAPTTNQGKGIEEVQDRITVDAEGKVYDLQGNQIGSINERDLLIDLAGAVIGKVLEDGTIVDNEATYMGRDTRVKDFKKLPAVAPSFYLNSVMFYTPKNWTIWLNHRRIRRGKELNGLTITNITEDYVDMIWAPLDLDYISTDWKEKVLPIGKGISRELGIPFTQEQINDIAKDVASSEVVYGEQETATSDVVKKAVKEQKEKQEKEKIKEAEEEKQEKTSEEIAEEVSAEIDNSLGDLAALLKEEQQAPKKAKRRKREAERAARKKEAEEKQNAEQLKAIEEKRKAKELEAQKKHTAQYANQEVDESDYKWEYKSPDGLILVDPINKIVKFRVGINQTFVSRKFGLEEGYKASARLQTPTPDGSVMPIEGQAQNLAPQSLEEELFNYSEEGVNAIYSPEGAAQDLGDNETIKSLKSLNQQLRDNANSLKPPGTNTSTLPATPEKIDDLPF